jgi:hypothetical protein
MGLSTNRRLQPAHLPRHADQRTAGRYVVIQGWVVRRYEARCGVAGALETLSRLKVLPWLGLRTSTLSCVSGASIR